MTHGVKACALTSVFVGCSWLLMVAHLHKILQLLCQIVSKLFPHRGTALAIWHQLCCPGMWASTSRTRCCHTSTALGQVLPWCRKPAWGHSPSKHILSKKHLHMPRLGQERELLSPSRKVMPTGNQERLRRSYTEEGLWNAFHVRICAAFFCRMWRLKSSHVFQTGHEEHILRFTTVGTILAKSLWCHVWSCCVAANHTRRRENIVKLWSVRVQLLLHIYLLWKEAFPGCWIWRKQYKFYCVILCPTNLAKTRLNVTASKRNWQPKKLKLWKHMETDSKAKSRPTESSP